MTQKELDNIRLVVEDRLHNWIKTSKSRRHVITIPSLAKQLDLPTKQVQTYFDKVCPLGFYGWLAKVRAKAAQEVISQHCDWDDIKVAQYVGLDTSHELEVVFKCTNGMTPSRWRDSVYQYDGKMPPHIQRVVDSIAPKLTEWEKNKGYCSLNVSVKDLSKQLDIPNHELELYISVIHPKGFDKHIDQLRISESKKIMTQNPSLSTSDVAKMVGYSGLFTFSQAFYRLLI